MKIIIYIIVTILSIFNLSYSQNPEWRIFNTSNSNITDNTITAISIDSSNHIWIGNSSGEINFFNGTNWNFYTIDNKYIIYDIKTDLTGMVWIGSQNGLSKYDGNEWKLFNSGNSGLPYDRIYSLEIDKENNIWLGLWDNTIVKYDRETWQKYRNDSLSIWQDSGVLKVDDSNNIWIGYYDDYSEDDGFGIIAKFDGISWINYTPSNSEFPVSQGIYSLAIGKEQIMWIGTSFDLVKYDDTTWTVFNTSNSGLPNNSVEAIAIDENDVKWIGTRGGLAKFDDTSWTVWNTDNSDLPSNWIICIVIDKYGNKWIGTDNGLAVFREGGVVGVEEPAKSNRGWFSFYSNPAEDIIKFRFHSIIENDVKISLSNYMGNTVKEYNLNSEQLQKTNETELDVSDLPSGIYFATIRAGGQVVTEKFLILR
ncbi:MAG: two-component regulator propeller domain-containing protein [bacterium]